MKTLNKISFFLMMVFLGACIVFFAIIIYKGLTGGNFYPPTFGFLASAFSCFICHIINEMTETK